VYPQPIYEQEPSDDSIGYGLWGCAGGLLAGFFGGGLLLIFLSLASAIATTVPVPAASQTTPDVRVTLAEAALNQLAQNSADNQVQLDILPGNQVSLTADTSVSAFGVSMPVQVTGLFGISITGQSSLEVRLIDVQVSGMELPPELTRDFFSSPLSTFNQNLNRMLGNASTQLGVPLVLTGLGTTDTELWLEARVEP
jgi:hypothetical protein